MNFQTDSKSEIGSYTFGLLDGGIAFGFGYLWTPLQSRLYNNWTNERRALSAATVRPFQHCPLKIALTHLSTLQLFQCFLCCTLLRRFLAGSHAHAPELVLYE